MRLACFFVAVAAMLAGQTPMESGAVADSRKAIAMHPNSAKDYVSLARALLDELAPNLSLFPDVRHLLPQAEQAAQHALELAPADADAFCVLGIVEYKTSLTITDRQERARRLTMAENAFNHALRADSSSLEAHCELAHMVADQAATAMLAAVIASGRKFGQRGPLENPNARKLLQTRYSHSIEDAFAYIERALAIDPEYEPAVRQMAALLSLRATLRDEPAEFEADMASAEVWQKKDAALIGAINARNPPNFGGGVLGGVIGGLPNTAPPPPPPRVSH